MPSEPERQHLIIVSNRLPVSVKKVDGTYRSSLSSGGLVTSLSGLTKSTSFRWFGWPGIEVNDSKDREQVSQSLDEHSAVGIFLDNKLAHAHYNEFSSRSLSSFLSLSLSLSLSSYLCAQKSKQKRMQANRMKTRLHPLANPPLPIRGDIRRKPLARLQESQRALRRRYRPRSHQRIADLDPRLPSHAPASAPPRTTREAGSAVRDWVLAAHAISGCGFLEGVAGAK